MARSPARASSGPLPLAWSLCAVAVLGCRSDEATGPTRESGGPSMVIEDAQHGASDRRNPHFFWLPPLVPAPNPPGGAPDPSVLASLRVDICDLGESRPAGTTCAGKPLIATFTSTVATYIAGTSVTTGASGTELVGYAETDGFYQVNWHTDKTPLLTNHYYRIRILAAGIELGQADIDVLPNARDLKNYDTGNSIPLVDGRTLPIKFRVETGAIRLLEPGGAPAEVGSKGGVVVTADGAVAIKVPEAAVPAGTTIHVEPAIDHPPGPEPWAPVYELTTSAGEFAQPVTVALAVNFDQLPEDVPPTSLALYVATDEGWELVPNSTVNLDDNTVSAPTTHFSIYSVQIAPNTFGGVSGPFVLEVGSAATLSGYTASYQIQQRQDCWTVLWRRTCRTYTDVTHYPEFSAIYWSSSNSSVAVPEPSVTYTASGGAIQTSIRSVGVGVAEIRARTPNGVVSNPVAVTATPHTPGAPSPLGTFGGGESYAFGMNEQGQIVGWSKISNGERRAFMWTPSAPRSRTGIMVNLGALPGSQGTHSEAFGISKQGEVVGYSTYPGNQGNAQAAMWQGGQLTLLGTLGGIGSWAKDVNDNAQQKVIVGYSLPPTNNAWRAVRWVSGVIDELEEVGGMESYAEAVNDVGQIVGRYRTSSGIWSGFLWHGGQKIDLRLPGATDCYAYGINQHGYAVGWCSTGAGRRGFLWIPSAPQALTGSIVQLGVRPGDQGTHSEAFGLNDLGQIVGYSTYPGNQGNAQAALWYIGSDGVPSTLSNPSLLGTPGGIGSWAYDINNGGQAAGFGLPSSNAEWLPVVYP